MHNTTECTCDYIYTCPACSAKMDAENALDYANEIRDWTIQSLQIIAKALGIEIPEPPTKRQY